MADTFKESNRLWREAGNESTSPERLHEIATAGYDLGITAQVASNPNTSVKTLEFIKNLNDPNFNSRIASNKNTPPEMLSGLVKTDKLSTIRAVAANRNASQDTLREICNDVPDDIAYERLAENPSTPPDVLIELSKTFYGSILVNVAMNPNTPEEVLTRLADSELTPVRNNVAKNPKTPIPTMMKLKEDHKDLVRSTAKDALKQRDILSDLLGESRCYESFEEWKKIASYK